MIYESKDFPVNGLVRHEKFLHPSASRNLFSRFSSHRSLPTSWKNAVSTNARRIGFLLAAL